MSADIVVEEPRRPSTKLSWHPAIAAAGLERTPDNGMHALAIRLRLHVW